DFGDQQRVRYRGRNVVERCFNKLKQWRGIAMRSDKTARNYHAGLCLAATLHWLTSTFSNTPYNVFKMKYAGKAGAWDKSTIKYNAFITVTGIPLEAQEYMLGSRSGLDWILERYQVKTDKASGIVNDPNDWSREHEQPRYILDLISRIVTLSLETNRSVNDLPDLAI
ncbi:type ISP restriction/modification enzyme, partial [Galactobacter valiniphilus]|uniref:type ISP restriction/modification enzyme n=1 Tax=Galactobacter valiniphilus TaxID=2676122 RepID=UPI002D76B540